MRSLTTGILGVALSLSLFAPTIAQAALTTDQISSVIGLLQSFGVDAATISNVKMVLSNEAPEMRATTDASMSSTEPKKPSGERMMPPGQVMMPPGQVMKAAACVTLRRTLNAGSQGEDVKALQHMLLEDGTVGFEGTATGVFGPKTLEAMKRFQMKNSIAPTPTGTVGPVTRAFLERRCAQALEKLKANNSQN